MNQLVFQILAVVALIILALAITATGKDGARIVQGGIVIAIVVVLFRNTGAATGALQRITRTAIGTPPKESGS